MQHSKTLSQRKQKQTNKKKKREREKKKKKTLFFSNFQNSWFYYLLSGTGEGGKGWSTKGILLVFFKM